MKIFVTGSESFIGKVLLNVCSRLGIDVFGVDLCAPSAQRSAPADIRSPLIGDLIPDKTDAIVHLAAISRDSDCRSNPRLGYDINVMGTVNLMEAARARGVKQFVFASSEWVYGEVSCAQIQTEDQPIDVTRLKSEYAFSKIAGEQMLRLAYAQTGTAVTILRFGIVYGPRMQNWSAVESLVHNVARGGVVRIGSRATARRFIHVNDIADGICASLGRSGLETFNLSGNDLVTLGQVIDEALRISGQTIRVEETAPSQASIRNPDNRRAKTVLGWQPRVDLAQGVRDVLSLFQRKEAA